MHRGGGGRWTSRGGRNNNNNGRGSSRGRMMMGRGSGGGRDNNSRGGGRFSPDRRWHSNSSGTTAHRSRYNSHNNISSGGSGPRTYGPPDVIEEIGTRITDKTIAVAVEGCCHGQITAIYDRLRQHMSTGNDNSSAQQQQQHGDASTKASPETTTSTTTSTTNIDLLICCGDFQSLRTPADFHSLAVPAKYREIGTFHQYYSGEWKAPVLTIFIGGNHEASQPLSELYYGGWVAPNMYYLGAAGVVTYRGVRIGGISGIYKSHDHVHSRYELPPYDNSTLRSIYHYRNVEVYRLQCLTGGGVNAVVRHDPNRIIHDHDDDSQKTKNHKRIDVMISHDWPQGIEQYGDVDGLIRRKPFFRQEIADNALGSPPAAQLLHTIRPKYWFSAHLHVKFRATVVHHPDKSTSTKSATVAAAESTQKPSSIAASTTTVTSLIPSQIIKSSTLKSSATAKKPVVVVAAEAADTAETDGPPSNELSNVDPVEKPLARGNEAVVSSESVSTQFIAPNNSLNTSPNPDLSDLMTQFLSLDKCLPRRQYLSIVHIPVDEASPTSQSTNLHYDLEWLAILRKTHHLSLASSQKKQRVSVPSTIEHAVTESDLEWIRNRIPDTTIPQNFVVTVPPYAPGTSNSTSSSSNRDTGRQQNLPPPIPRMGNPQTDQLLELLQLEHLPNLTIPYTYDESVCGETQQQKQIPIEVDENEIDLLDYNGDTHNSTMASTDIQPDEDEIDLEEASDMDNNNQIETTEACDEQQDAKKPRLGTGSQTITDST